MGDGPLWSTGGIATAKFTKSGTAAQTLEQADVSGRKSSGSDLVVAAAGYFLGPILPEGPENSRPLVEAPPA